jgi:hypothetical protein
MRPESERVQQKQYNKRKVMSKDASEFSLEKEGNKIRPHIVDLSFRRLSDYMGNNNLKDKVHCTEYYLNLWEANTKLQGNLEKNWKAYVVPIDRRIILTQFVKRPKRIEYGRIIILCPHNDSVLWAFQELKFIPERGTNTYFQGSSEIWSVNDQNLTAIIHPKPDFWETLHEGLLKWMGDTIEAKQKVISSLEQFHKECSGQWSKKIVENQTAGFRKGPIE